MHIKKLEHLAMKLQAFLETGNDLKELTAAQVADNKLLFEVKWKGCDYVDGKNLLVFLLDVSVSIPSLLTTHGKPCLMRLVMNNTNTRTVNEIYIYNLYSNLSLWNIKKNSSQHEERFLDHTFFLINAIPEATAL